MNIPLWIVAALAGAAAGFVLLVVIAIGRLAWQLTSNWKWDSLW